MTAALPERAAGRVRLVVFLVADGRFAVELAGVAGVIRAVAVRAVAEVPEVVAGVIDYHGSLVPAFDLRRRLRLAARALGPDDQFLLVRTARRLVALVVDAVEGLSEYSADAVLPAAELADAAGGLVAGVVSHAAGIVVIHDVERFLSAAEAEQVDRSLAELAAADAHTRAGGQGP